MSRLTTRVPSDLQADTIQALEPVKQNGKIADVYLQFSNGEAALRAYLHMEASLRDGSLNDAELEAVKLWMSEQTGCEFCLSVHSFKAGQAGLNKEGQLAVRADRKTGNVRIDMLLKIAKVLYQTRGSLSQELLEEARNAGISDENLVDLTMTMATIFFTNITNHINDSRSPLPPAPELVDK